MTSCKLRSAVVSSYSKFLLRHPSPSSPSASLWAQTNHIHDTSLRYSSFSSSPSSSSSFSSAAYKFYDEEDENADECNGSENDDFRESVFVNKTEGRVEERDMYKQQQQQEHESSAHKHCGTCTCTVKEETPSTQPTPPNNKSSLPPPLQPPKFSFHRRRVPSNLTPLSSPTGRVTFTESLLSGHAESYFALSEQSLNQSDPAYCGVTTLCVVLNALAIDPNVRWKGGWRWYGSEDVVMANCCLDVERVKRVGVTMEEFWSLGRCQGARIQMKRPLLSSSPISLNRKLATSERHRRSEEEQEGFTLDDFRNDVRWMVSNPPFYDESSSSSRQHDDDDKKGFMVVSFDRSQLSQTGGGHFSPVAAYHEPTDSCLILDVARFKYAPYWVSTSELYNALLPIDPDTGKSRGWFVVRRPLDSVSTRLGGSVVHRRSQVRPSGTKPRADEAKRPADLVPLAGMGDPCPVGVIKMRYCSVSTLSNPKE